MFDEFLVVLRQKQYNVERIMISHMLVTTTLIYLDVSNNTRHFTLGIKKNAIALEE